VAGSIKVWVWHLQRADLGRNSIGGFECAADIDLRDFEAEIVFLCEGLARFEDCFGDLT
jgi:hypothetical protein